MHLLVLSAFRPRTGSLRQAFRYRLNAPFGAQCFPTHDRFGGGMYKDSQSQCTFWCSVLSDPSSDTSRTASGCLNAPFGAQCFPTRCVPSQALSFSYVSQCTFWCSVLSDFPIGNGRFVAICRLNAPFGAQCFPTPRPARRRLVRGYRLNAPFGAQCFPTGLGRPQSGCHPVSMHLLVLSAFRHAWAKVKPDLAIVSQCTFWCSVLSDQMGLPGKFGNMSLNAPFGAQCFPTRFLGITTRLSSSVSMHLLVLSAFRHAKYRLALSATPRLNAPFGAQCFPTG